MYNRDFPLSIDHRHRRAHVPVSDCSKGNFPSRNQKPFSATSLLILPFSCTLLHNRVLWRNAKRDIYDKNYILG